MIDCIHKDGNNCKVAAGIINANHVDNRTDELCAKCIKQSNQFSKNHVTYSIASSYLRMTNINEWRDFIKNNVKFLRNVNDERLEKILNGDGVGSCMWKILDSIGIKHTANCPCLDWAERMNAWGPDLCNKNRKQIIEHMKLSSKNYGWGDVARAIRKAIENKLIYKLNPLDPFGSLLNEAIRIAIKKEPIDIFIPLGPGSRYENIEIKYALRSIEKYAIGWRKIWIVGAIPSFLHETDRIRLIQKNEYKCNKQSRVQRKIQWAIENLSITDNFAYWNDDFLVLKQFDIRCIPNYVNGNISLSKQNSGWRECRRRTGQMLKDSGKTIYNFDIHVPLIFNKEKHLQLKEWWHKLSNETPLMRSLYGNNFCSDNIQRLRDIKLQQKWKIVIDNILNGNRWVISYGDGALKTGFGEWMQAFLPTKSSFE